jgi:hypothetical protein
MEKKIKQTLVCVILTLGITFLFSHHLYAQCTVQPEQRVSDVNSSCFAGPPTYPNMATDASGNIFAVWYDERTTPGAGVYLTKLDSDGNRLWPDDKLVSLGWYALSGQDVAVDPSGNVYIAYVNSYTVDEFSSITEITISKFDNDGTELIPPKRVTFTVDEITVDPSIITKRGIAISMEPGGNYLHMAWNDNRLTTVRPLVYKYEIYYNKLDTINYDPVFPSDIRVSYYSDTPDYGGYPESQWPSIAADGTGKAHISWETRTDIDDFTVDWRIYYNKIDPAGTIAFPGDIDVSGSHAPTQMALRSQVAADSQGNAHIAWHGHHQTLQTNDIYYSKILPDGNLAVDFLNISNSPNSQVQVKAGIAVDANDEVHVAYAVFTEEDMSSFPPMNKYHIYYTKLDNNGSVQIPSSQLTIQDAPMTAPDLTVDLNNEAHIVWSDGRESLDYAFFKLYYVKACFDDTDTDADGDGYTVLQGDCDDTDPNTYPGAAELCDGLDNDCSGAPDVDEVDGDADGVMLCAGDCDDTDPNNYPGNPEVCDGLDNDCSGALDVDEVDGDADGVMLCAGDCNDIDPNTYPGATELCDGLDNDCDTVVPADESDADSDGYRICEGDCDDSDSGINCDDSDSGINPGACDIKSNGIDEDCDGSDRLKGKPCSGSSSDSGGSEGKGKSCSDTLDNDGDGLIDCADPDCSKNRACR